MKSRSLECQRLEPRHLLAGDVCFPPPPGAASVQHSDAEGEIVLESIIGPAASRSTDSAATDSLAETEWLSIPGRPTSSGYDLLVEDSDQIFAVRMHSAGIIADPDQPVASIHIFDRAEDGALTETGTIDLTFAPRELIAMENQLVVVGQHDKSIVDGIDSNAGMQPHTELINFSRDDWSVTDRVEIDSPLVAIAHRSGRVFVTTSQPAESGWPTNLPAPPTSYSVAVFAVGQSQLTPIAAGVTAAPVGEGAIVGDDLWVIEPDDPPRVGNLVSTVQSPESTGAKRLVHYRLSAGGSGEVGELNEVGSLTIGGRAEYDIRLSADGTTAAIVSRPQVVRPETPTGTIGGVTDVLLIDLATTTPTLFESITVSMDSFGAVSEFGDSEVVLADGPNRLIFVNTDQSIDIDAGGRVRRMELPPAAMNPARGVSEIVSVSDRRYLIIRGTQSQPGSSRELLVVSSAESSTLSRSEFDADLVAVLDSSGEPTLIGYPPLRYLFVESGRFSPSLSLLVATLGESDPIAVTDRIHLGGTFEWDADPTRLLLRQVDQVTEFRWDDLDNPIRVPLGEPLPPPVALDDVLIQNADAANPYLSVLENDSFVDSFLAGPVEIVDLIGQPDGVVVAEDRRGIRLTKDALATEGVFEFDYVIEQGNKRSTATVSLTLVRYTEQDVEQTLDTIRRFAAQQRGVELDELRTGAVTRYIRSPIPDFLMNRPTDPLGGQFGVFAEIGIGDQIGRYAASFDGEVVSLGSRTISTVMELRPRLVDESGVPIQTLRVGDQFFVEINAQDLRPLGNGVFAVAFDLTVPIDQIKLTGDLTMMGDFNEFFETNSESEFDEFHAFEALIDHPGDDVQSVVRFAAQAIGTGSATIQLDPAEGEYAELLLRGRDTLVSPLEVAFRPLTVPILDPIRATDTDADGNVTPNDALRVINFLGVFGSRDVAELDDVMLEGESVSNHDRVAEMKRLDTNLDGVITPLDALFVINELAVEGSQLEAESPTVAELSRSLLSDDDRSDDLRPGPGTLF